jgi:hypothetical protein
VHRVASELRKHQGGSRSGLSGINRPVKNLNRNPRQANQLLSQQNRHKADMLNSASGMRILPSSLSLQFHEYAA